MPIFSDSILIIAFIVVMSEGPWFLTLKVQKNKDFFAFWQKMPARRVTANMQFWISRIITGVSQQLG